MFLNWIPLLTLCQQLQGSEHLIGHRWVPLTPLDNTGFLRIPLPLLASSQLAMARNGVWKQNRGKSEPREAQRSGNGEQARVVGDCRGCRLSHWELCRKPCWVGCELLTLSLPSLRMHRRPLLQLRRKCSQVNKLNFSLMIQDFARHCNSCFEASIILFWAAANGIRGPGNWADRGLTD